MAPSRRLKHQGMPAPLDEPSGAKKRKSAAPTNSAIKKQKKAGVVPAAKNSQNGKGAANSAAKGSTKGDFKAQQKPAGKPQKKAQLVDSDEEDISGMSDEDLGDLDDEEGGAQVSGLDALEDDSDADDFANAPSDLDDEDVVDSDREVQHGVWSEDDESDGEEALTAANMAGLSAKLDKERAEEEAAGEEELRQDALQTNIAAADLDLDEDGEDAKKQSMLAPDLQMLRTRITEAIRVLSNFKELRDPARSRADYTQAVIKDICAYYGYSPFLAEKLFSLFPPQEALSFFDANETPRPMVIRTNTLRTHRRDLAHSLINRGVTLEPVGKWSKVGLQVFES
ncbi:hypothetical protein KC324_g7373, partial [Hortaea werneckii]